MGKWRFSTNLNVLILKNLPTPFSSENEAFEATRLRSTAAQKSATDGADAAGPAEVELAVDGLMVVGDPPGGGYPG